MEVIQWTALWNGYKEEFDNEKNLLGGPLVDKAAEDLKQRIIEHVISIQNVTLPFSLRIPAAKKFFLFLCFQNILVVSKYYSRITLKRLADLLCLSTQVC